MTLQNKSWLKNEILREFLLGELQETIAKNHDISVGS